MRLFRKFVNGQLCTATPIYEGHYNDEVFIMSFEDKEWFHAELKGLAAVSKKSYSPEVLDINIKNKQITLKWKDVTNLNHAFYYNIAPSDWKKQVKFILDDLENFGMYKINCYPHTFYIDNNVIRIMDLHACVMYHDDISESVISDVINNKERFKFTNGMLDIESTYNYTISNNIGDWPEELLDD